MKTFKQFLLHEVVVINPPSPETAKKVAKKRVSANTTIPASDTTSNYPSAKASDKGEF